VARLEAGFDLRKDAQRIIEFEENPYLKGSEHITTLFHAILGRQVLEVGYQGFKQDKPATIRFHPYYLKQYNNRWFVFGLNEEHGRIANMALDRILGLAPAKGSYKSNNLVDFSEYFEDVVGVSVPEELPQRVELHVNDELWPYLQTKPLHGSQKLLSRTNSGALIQLQVRLNHELQSLLLSFGDGLHVLKPEVLRKGLRRRILASLVHYI
jgi:predicted DNA-binding transcriptional regulator YafY